MTADGHGSGNLAARCTLGASVSSKPSQARPQLEPRRVTEEEAGHPGPAQAVNRARPYAERPRDAGTVEKSWRAVVLHGFEHVTHGLAYQLSKLLWSGDDDGRAHRVPVTVPCVVALRIWLWMCETSLWDSGLLVPPPPPVENFFPASAVTPMPKPPAMPART